LFCLYSFIFDEDVYNIINDWTGFYRVEEFKLVFIYTVKEFKHLFISSTNINRVQTKAGQVK